MTTNIAKQELFNCDCMVQPNIMQDRLQELFPVHYRNGNILMINADCMEVMKHIKDNEVELSCVDPPYGIGEDGAKAQSRLRSCKKWKNPTDSEYKNGEWDKEPPDEKYFSELFRVSKNQIIWGANHFISRIPFDSSCWIVWKKNGNCEGADFADCELAWSSFKTAVRFFDFPWTGFGAVNAKEKRIHPTQKPVSLYKRLLSRYAKPGDRILDTHGGSGSICIACHDLGFDLTWMELDEDYYKAACKRYKNHAAQATLFEPAELTKETQGELF